LAGIKPTGTRLLIKKKNKNEKKKWRVGVRVVVRDSKGIVIAARSLTQFATVESMAKEVMAAFYVARLCKDIGEEAI
jgi:hypothetical protein